MQLMYMVINVWQIDVWRGIHVQLTYTVINLFRINVWRGHSHTATIHSN